LSQLPKTAAQEILRTLVGIARLRQGPEDLPTSASLLALMVMASIVPDAVLLAILPVSFQGNGAALIAIGIFATLFWFGLVLRMAGKSERTLQTLTAVFGFQLVLAPALVFSGWFFALYNQDPTWQFPAAMLRLVVEVWALAVLARILRSATEWPLFACVMLAVANELLALLLVLSLFPQPDAAAAAVPV
jgi:hypothetical protein